MSQGVVVSTYLYNYFRENYGGDVVLKVNNLMPSKAFVWSVTMQKLVGIMDTYTGAGYDNTKTLYDNGEALPMIYAYSQNSFISENALQLERFPFSDVVEQFKKAEPQAPDTSGLQRKIDARKMMVEDMIEDGDDPDKIMVLKMKIELYEEQLEE